MLLLTGMHPRLASPFRQETTSRHTLILASFLDPLAFKSVDFDSTGPFLWKRTCTASSQEPFMETVNEVQSFVSAPMEARSAQANDDAESMKPTILGWFRVLRAHYQWPLFVAIRYALWLSR